jgi:hypothetical protein
VKLSLEINSLTRRLNLRRDVNLRLNRDNRLLYTENEHGSSTLKLSANTLALERASEQREIGADMHPDRLPNDVKTYEDLSAEDRRTFERWVGAYAAVCLTLMVALIAVVVIRSFSKTEPGTEFVSRPERVLVGSP